ncbi:YigZ family protein [Rhizobium grahamii]|uniref:YigZ family protein n=1 Tax=Rhizobium grahamii TaxID=1120045 RepID=A0A5Q0CA06_9HYPH|nr:MULTISPECIES: YigZ family protein [Rhizobium]QFY61234.1 YigZ family protein [Rhizobium grahamii]QRM49616.1 YigZ family protein [Rhizobium sp. BG6]
MFALERVESLEQIVKKSRFRAIAAPVASEQAAKDFLASHSDLGANHNCWAWRIGQAYRFSDDGEPSGTAGKPILQAIDGQSLDNVAVVVTRWFGGVLLGTGGLIRAYGGTAAACLRAAPIVELIPTLDAAITVQFSDLALVKAKLAAFPAVRIVQETFVESGAALVLTVPQASAADIAVILADATSGRVVLAPES